MNRTWSWCLILLIACLTARVDAAAQTTQPATSPSAISGDAPLGGQSLRGSDTTSRSPFFGSPGISVQSSGILDLLRIAIALVVVIGVILALRFLVQNLGRLPGSKSSGRLVTVMSRSILAPRQQVMVLQVGKRLIVVGDSGGQMNTLCEISDPDEIAELIGQTRSDQTARLDRVPGSFGNLFRRANEPFTDGELAEQPTGETIENVEPITGVTSEDVSGLLEKVKMLQQQFKH